MKWIVPAVVIAIAALIIFQVNWLTREAKMKAQEDRQDIREAMRVAIREFGKQEAIGFIGNSLDSVFMKKSFPRHDSMHVEVFNDSTQQVIIINDSVMHGGHPIPPHPPRAPGGHAQFEPPMPEPPMVWERDSAQVIVMRQERMKNAVEDVMLHYVFSAGDPQEHIKPKYIDSLLRDAFREKGIEHPYNFSIIMGGRSNVSFGDVSVRADSSWTFVEPLFPGEPTPFHPRVVVSVDPGNNSVISRILPQIIFSVLITLGMLILFILIYREALKQKKISEIRRDFINNMTHEFKTPLATMSLAADTIMNEKVIGDKDKVKYYAEQIKNENRKLNQQVEKVLELSLTEKNGITLHKEEVNLVELIKRAVDSMQLQVEARGGKISFDSSLGELKIMTDPFHLERVFLNLIDNAMKYGGVPPLISITIENYRSGVEVKISDNGKGIPHEEWKAIFEPFHRFSTGDIHNVKGFGLGLSYAQSVVRQHKGSLTVTKSNISGTTFTLVLMDV